MAHDGAGDAAKQRPPHRPIGARSKHEQVDVRTSRIQDRRGRIATHQDHGLDRDSVTERETWQERGELDRLRRELDVPVTHIVVEETGIQLQTGA